MGQPLKNDSVLKQDSTALLGTGLIPEVESSQPQAVPSSNVWKPVIVRVVLSGLALLGLAGVGAASMLAGLDGARADSSRVASTQSPSSATSAVATTGSARPAASAAPGAPLASASAPAQPPATVPCAGRTADGKVILNLATVADLRTLRGIGQKRADAILALRDKLKRFRRIQELRRVRGIGAKTLMRLAPNLLVDPPAGTCAN